jgi:hypothetical protein
LWHELPLLDKRLSSIRAKLTATLPNANILKLFKDKDPATERNFFYRKPETGNRKPKTVLKMEIKPLDFLIGLSLGLALGAGGTMLVSRIRGWLGYSETGRLRAENRVLSRRLAAKDRHIGRMLAETQRLAERLGKKSVNELSGKSDETLTTDH